MTTRKDELIVTRYGLDIEGGKPSMEPSEDGAWISFADYQDVMKRVEREVWEKAFCKVREINKTDKEPVFKFHDMFMWLKEQAKESHDQNHSAIEEATSASGESPRPVERRH